VFIALGLTTTLLVASCGSDDDSSSATNLPTTTPEATTAEATTPAGTTPDATAAESTTPASIDPSTFTNGQGVTDTEITIGVVLDQSGPFSLLAPGIKAAFDAKLAVTNDNGGVVGRMLRAEYIDDKSDPTQTLQAFKRLWEQDKVYAIYVANINGPPLDYVKENNIPVTLLGGPPAVFGSQYPSVIPTGSLTPAWNAQASYAVVNFLDKRPKVVAVTYLPFEEPMLDWIENSWKQLGAEEVLFDPFPDPTAPCDTLVLKYKDAGVEYWDMHATSFLTCIPAQLTAGWSPPMGQGGPSTSSLDLASLIGKPMADLNVIAGSPNALADGKPTDLTPTPQHIEYQEAMAKYSGDWANSHDLNDFVPQIAYTAAIWFVDGIKGGAEMTGEISGDSLLEWAHTVKDWDPFLAEPVKSMAPDCKTGNDSTIWGMWVWDDATEKLHMEPFAPLPGEPMVNSDFLGYGECYLTELADKYFS